MQRSAASSPAYISDQTLSCEDTMKYNDSIRLLLGATAQLCLAISVDPVSVGLCFATAGLNLDIGVTDTPPYPYVKRIKKLPRD